MMLVEVKDLLKLLRSQFCNIVHVQRPNIVNEWFEEPCPQLHRSPGQFFYSHKNYFKNERCHSTVKRKSRIFFSCYHFASNDSALLKAMNMNQTYLWGKDPTVSGVIKIFHFSSSNQSTHHSPLKLLLLHGAPTSLREKVLFIRSNKNLSFYIWGDCFWHYKILFRALISFRYLQFFVDKKREALNLIFESVFAWNVS